MATIRLQGEAERRKGIFYQVDMDTLPIGEGGMGKVFKGLCVNERNGATRPVAIKFMFDDLPASAYERARREAEIQLRNDNLIEMLGFIETQEQTTTGEVVRHYHVVSELLTGVSLSDVMEGKTKDRDGEDVPFAVKMLQDYQNDPEHFAQVVVMNVLSGLMALHDAGYIHRDIDPSNIMLTAEGHIKLIDFGIAKQMNTLTTSDKSLTVAGKFMGKPEYAAPELALGDISHQNQTTDIYAVGILLYQCIVGHTPFEGARHEILDKQLKAKMPLDKIKNKALRRIVATACEKKQELRYQTSAQMRVALETMNGATPAMSSKKKWVFVAAAVAVVVVLFAAVFLVKSKQGEAREVAENALIEQQRQQFAASMQDLLAKADDLMAQGQNKELDDYDQKLMEAYQTYAAIEDSVTARNDSTLFSVADIADKKAVVAAALDSAFAEFSSKVTELEDLGAVDVAQTYKQKLETITNFKNKMK